MILLALAGCLDRLLESPYVLAPGLGEARSVTARADGRLVIATSTGVYAVDGEGRAERLEEAPADAVAADPNRTYVLRAGRVTWPGGGLDTPGAVDVLAGYGELVVLYPDAYEHIDVATGARTRLRLGERDDARAIALGPDESYLVVTPDSVYRTVSTGGLRPVVTDLVDARAAAMDGKGRLYVAHGDPEELWRVDPGGLSSVARWLGDPRDLQFGVGGLLPLENTYVANGMGTLDYVRPPP